MNFIYNSSWAFFIAGEKMGKTFQTKRLINAIMPTIPRPINEHLLILDPNNLYIDFQGAEIIVPAITDFNSEWLDNALRVIRSYKDILFIADDVDVFLKTGYDSNEIDMLGKTIRQQNIGGILHAHRAKFFNSRIFQICDYVFVGYNLNTADTKYLADNINLDLDLYNKLKPRQFVLIEINDKKKQRIIDVLGE